MTLHLTSDFEVILLPNKKLYHVFITFSYNLCIDAFSMLSVMYSNKENGP